MSLSMVLPPMYPRSPPTAGRNLEISQPGKDLPTNLNQFIQPLLQVLHVGGIDPTIFIGGFGVLIQVVAAHLQEICHALQVFQKLVVLYCKQLGINYKNLSDEEFRWLIRILQKSKKTGTPISQRKKR